MVEINGGIVNGSICIEITRMAHVVGIGGLSGNAYGVYNKNCGRINVNGGTVRVNCIGR